MVRKSAKVVIVQRQINHQVHWPSVRYHVHLPDRYQPQFISQCTANDKELGSGLEMRLSIAISHPTDALSGHQTSKATAIGKCCYK